jgi:predicted phage terminase large subunit-like protein
MTAASLLPLSSDELAYYESLIPFANAQELDRIQACLTGQEKQETGPRTNLYDFTREAWSSIEPNPFSDNWHIGLICEHLQAVSEGQIAKLLVNIPPGCSKSLLTSVFWPAWEWTFAAHIRWAFASYDQRLATRDSVKTRALICSSWYRERWASSFSLSKDQDQKTYFENNRGGYRLATSVRGHVMGEHPHRKVIDDPMDMQAAESEAERQAVHDWFDLAWSSRGVALDATNVIIAQRLHEDDEPGRAKKEGDWVEIMLPMRYESDRAMKKTVVGGFDPRTEEGQLLDKDRFPEEKVAELEKRLGPYGIAGQLQQNPIARHGGLFERGWFEIVNSVPADLKFVRYWDMAATKPKPGSDPDYAVGLKIGKAVKSGIFYIVDVRRTRSSPQGVQALVEQTAAVDGKEVAIWMEQEPGSSGKIVIDDYVRILAGYCFKGDRVTGDKITRAGPLSSQAQAGNVKLLSGPWNQVFLDEIEIFPQGKHDDQVDAASGGFGKVAAGRPEFRWYGDGEEKKEESAEPVSAQ